MQYILLQYLIFDMGVMLTIDPFPDSNSLSIFGIALVLV